MSTTRPMKQSKLRIRNALFANVQHGIDNRALEMLKQAVPITGPRNAQSVYQMMFTYPIQFTVMRKNYVWGAGRTIRQCPNASADLCMLSHVPQREVGSQAWTFCRVQCIEEGHCVFSLMECC